MRIGCSRCCACIAMRIDLVTSICPYPTGLCWLPAETGVHKFRASGRWRNGIAICSYLMAVYEYPVWNNILVLNSGDVLYTWYLKLYIEIFIWITLYIWARFLFTPEQWLGQWGRTVSYVKLDLMHTYLNLGPDRANCECDFPPDQICMNLHRLDISG